MWSSIVDDKGKEMVSIFYKAAFYDRDAFYIVDRDVTLSFRKTSRLT
jgi:hypothetical protein